ncbi:UNVERIFIED_CONTAM: hypothetical protein FKN15_033094 [Acipenser sinensis]
MTSGLQNASCTPRGAPLPDAPLGPYKRFGIARKSCMHARVKFALMYPAVLRIDTTEGSRRFEDPKKAMDYIQSLTK